MGSEYDDTTTGKSNERAVYDFSFQDEVGKSHKLLLLVNEVNKASKVRIMGIYRPARPSLQPAVKFVEFQ